MSYRRLAPTLLQNIPTLGLPGERWLSWRWLAPFGLFTLLASGTVAAEFPTRRAPVDANVSVCFVPSEDCEGEVADAINRSNKQIRVQAYGFTSTRILNALVGAVRRGIDVQLVLDKSNAEKRYAGARLMALAGAKVWIDDRVAIAHNKVIVIDGWEVVGGSFNYTKSAQTRNAENVTFISSPDVAAWFESNWEERKSVSSVYVPK
jgi:phospholipase D